MCLRRAIGHREMMISIFTADCSFMRQLWFRSNDVLIERFYEKATVMSEELFLILGIYYI